jgi:hypothetical protein
MDDVRFDGLSRLVGKVSSRRLAAGTLIAGTAASVMPSFRGEEAQAKNKKKKPKKCKCGAGKIKIGNECVTGSGTCAAGQSICGDPLATAPTCNGAQGCNCVTSVSGATRCGKAPVGLACGQCASDASCAEQFGVGAFCVESTSNQGGIACSCEIVGEGFCLLPC